MDDSLAHSVEQEGAESAREHVEEDVPQIETVELKSARIQVQQLIDAVHPLEENGRSVAVVDAPGFKGRSQIELMAESAPLLLDQDLQANDRPIVRVRDQLCQRRDLRCPVPAIAAVHDAGNAVMQRLGGTVGSGQNEPKIV